MLPAKEVMLKSLMCRAASLKVVTVTTKTVIGCWYEMESEEGAVQVQKREMLNL
jgi:hypothetical protein